VAGALRVRAGRGADAQQALHVSPPATEALALADEINARHAGAAAHLPIVLLVRHVEPEQVFELFRAADVCIVSCLHDGMNLVAKEFVAARDDEQGVLILSSFAGASRELSEALIVNPYDSHAMSEMLHRALVMPKSEQRPRMQVMRDIVRSRNVHRWAGQMLLDAAQLRKRREIIALATQGRGQACPAVYAGLPGWCGAGRRPWSCGGL
jgi:trehalose-6-phosphate synthase